LLPQLPECWGYRCVPPHLAKVTNLDSRILHEALSKNSYLPPEELENIAKLKPLSIITGTLSSI
jgi:hypothetical protein